MTETKKILARSDVAHENRWNLTSLFADSPAWEAALETLKNMEPRILDRRRAFEKAFSSSLMTPEIFLAVLALYAEYGLLSERLGYYAHLCVSVDEGDACSRGNMSRYMAADTQIQAAWSWFVPALQTLREDFIQACLADTRFSDYRVFIEKLRRFKPHVLSPAEEKLLALQAEPKQTANETFRILTNVDLYFGDVDTKEGPQPLTQSTFASFMRNPDRSVRRNAYVQFYSEYDAHKNTLASLYAGSVKLDKYQAQVRNYASAREAALFPDNVPVSVYDNLVSTIHANLGALHDYYALRAQLLGLQELRHYDVNVPLFPEAQAHHSYDQAVDIVCSALAPLGEEYVSTLRKGLVNGWVDRYENKGKRSGAFSAGSYSGWPYILMNYKEDVLRDIFTLAHEGGHSMHSWYAARNNPFSCYNYTIFEAEVASTFNEQLVFEYLYTNADSDAARTSLLASMLDSTLGTLFRQTMFAEYELRTHAMLEKGEPLTVDSLRAEYRSLLTTYFGPIMKFEDLSDLEALRIPHFYEAFYVYKYSTGVSASIALSERVLRGGKKEREEYFAFLKSGGSRFPIDALKVAGVDMSTPAPVQAACAQFASQVKELRRLVGQ